MDLIDRQARTKDELGAALCATHLAFNRVAGNLTQDQCTTLLKQCQTSQAAPHLENFPYELKFRLGVPQVLQQVT